MPLSHRTTARLVISLTILALTAGSVAATAGARGARVPPLIFPVIGAVQYGNDFGAARPQGWHEGNDIMAPRWSIAAAVEAGKVRFHTTSARAGCMLYLYGQSGTTYLYIHLNNDLTKENDNRGGCVSGVAYWPGLKDGASVEAGEPIGYVGDSGDANGGAAHLHFEIQPKGRGSTNPYRYLNRATRLLFAAPRGSAITLSLTGSVVTISPKSITLKVAELTVFPLNIRLLKVRKPVTLSLPPTALVVAGRGARPAADAGSSLGVSLAGRRVLVLTEPAAATLETQAAKAGAFSAARIVVR